MKERLSKLQKWILQECYKGKLNYDIYSEKWADRYSKDYILDRSQLYRYFFPEFPLKRKGESTLIVHQWSATGKYLKDNQIRIASATITRSIMNLFKEGYIDVNTGALGGGCNNWELESHRKIRRELQDILKEIREKGKPKVTMIGVIDHIETFTYTLEDTKERIIARSKAIRDKKMWFLEGFKIKQIKLLKKGIDKAKQLLNVNIEKFSSVNNKESIETLEL